MQSSSSSSPSKKLSEALRSTNLTIASSDSSVQPSINRPPVRRQLFFAETSTSEDVVSSNPASSSSIDTSPRTDTSSQPTSIGCSPPEDQFIYPSVRRTASATTTPVPVSSTLPTICNSFSVNDIFYSDKTTSFTQAPVMTDIMTKPDKRVVWALIERGLRTNNLSLLLRCKDLPKETRNVIFLMRKRWPQLELFVEIHREPETMASKEDTPASTDLSALKRHRSSA